MAREFAAWPENTAPELTELMRLEPDAFRRRFRGSPIKRARYAGFLRNVAVALGNSGDPGAVPVLVESLEHAETLVRGHAAWALGELGGERAAAALEAALETETDPWVRVEIGEARRRLHRPRPATLKQPAS